MKIEALRPLHLRRAAGDLHLRIGESADLSIEEVAKLPPGRVRIVQDAEVVMEAALKPDGSPLSPVFWERAGAIVGPGIPEFLAKAGEEFWIVVQFRGQACWVNANQLRSRQQFEDQQPLKSIELMKDFVL